MHKINKIDIAVQELEDALDAYFAQRYHSAIVLAGAAEELLSAYVKTLGLEPSWSQMRRTITKLANTLHIRETGQPGRTTEGNVGDLLNHAYNNHKHAGKNDHSVHMNPRFEAQELIDRCISNYDVLFSRLSLLPFELREINQIQSFVRESLGRDSLESEALELIAPVANASDGNPLA